METILITGGCGFIASNLIHKLLELNKYQIINVDKMSYCSNTKNISLKYNFTKHEMENTDLKNYFFYEADINDSETMKKILELHKVDYVYHFAAQSHVDKSFGNSGQFVIDNVLGTCTLLECCREYGLLKKFIHVSTDEVYGEIRDEKDIKKIKKGLYDPTNPYAASKAAAELMVKSYQTSYHMPIIITRSNNVYGPRQYWEKIIPKFIYLLSNNEKCTVYGDGQAMRKYLYVDDACDAYIKILENGDIGQIYEMGTDIDYTSLEITEKIIKSIKPDDSVKSWINHVADRYFHDHRYFVNMDTMNTLNWSPKTTIETGLQKTIEWYINYAIPNKYWSSE